MKNKTITLGSLFDGSGGFPLGGLLAGISPVWASEIEPFPIRVTTKRLPFMKHYGNISAMDGGKIEPVDIITFGSPCQDMSVAGRRDGLDGSRSSLFYEAVRIIKEMRCATDGKYPRWICWENVPGAFSSNKGEDFKAVLEAVIGIVEPNAQVPMPEKARWPYADLYMGDGWSVAYRTLDAQYWGVPQRRRRIYLVADLAGRSAGKILFESEGLSGYSAEGFRSWQRAAGSFTPCAGATGFDGYNGSLTDDTSATLGVNCGMSTGRNGIVLNDQGGDRIEVSEDVAERSERKITGIRPVSWSRQASALSIPQKAAPSAMRKNALRPFGRVSFLRRSMKTTRRTRDTPVRWMLLPRSVPPTEWAATTSRLWFRMMRRTR